MGERVEGSPVEKRIEQNKVIAKLAINRASEYLEEHNGSLRVDLGINLWLKTKQIDNVVGTGDTGLIRDLASMCEKTRPLTYERELLEGMVNRYIGALGENINNRDSVLCLLNLYERGTKVQKLRSTEILDRNFDQLEAMSQMSEHVHLSMWNYRLGRSLMDDEIGRKYRDKTSRYYYIPGGFEELITGISNPKTMDRGAVREQVEGMAVALGLDRKMTSDMVNSWLTLRWERPEIKEDLLEQIVKKNMMNLIELKNSMGVGWITRLYRDYGITHFGRYTVELLKKQVKEEDEDRPYGICLSAYGDWNGALYDENSKKINNMLVNSADKLGYTVKFVEARSKATVVRRIRELARKFPTQKIAFKLVDGHGQADRVLLGLGTEEEDSLSVNDLKKESAGKMKQFYTDNCPTLFDACSTGLEIGPAYSSGSGYSMSPDKPGCLTWLELGRDTEGNLFFDGAYVSPGKERPKTVIFFNGGNAEERLEKEKHKLGEISYQELLKDRKALEASWRDPSTLLYILKREKLDPLKKSLENKYGVGKKIVIESGFEGDDKDVGKRRMELDLDGETSDADWGTGFLEDIGSDCRYQYKKLKDERDKFWPEIRVIDIRESGEEVIVDRYKINMSNLWPENVDG